MKRQESQMKSRKFGGAGLFLTEYQKHLLAKDDGVVARFCSIIF